MQPLLSSSGFRDGLGERYLVFDHESGNIWERLLLRSELAAYETAVRRRVGRLASIQAPELVPVVSVERDPVTHRLAVLSNQAPGVRLHELLRAAREREIVPDLSVALYVAAQVLAATYAFHSLSGLPHGTLNPHHIVISPSGDLQITDYVFAEVIEAANFSRERLWHELHIAAWMGSDLFSFQADVRQAALIAIALMVGRPLEADDLTVAIDPLLVEVEEAAMIRGGRLFADPVGAWLVRALGAGSSEGYADAREAADACAALLTERERGEAARALPQLLDEICEPLAGTHPPVFVAPPLETTESVIPEAETEELPPAIESGITESEIGHPPITEIASEAPSSFAAWPDSALIETQPAPAGASEDVKETVALVDEMIAAVGQSAADRNAPAPVFESAATEEPQEEIAEPAPDAAALEEPVDASAAEPGAVSEEPEPRLRKRKKRRGRRGGAAEAPIAAQPPAAPAAPPVAATPLRPAEPLPVTPWAPASTANAPTLEDSRGISSASPLSILDRAGVSPGQPSTPSALPIETGRAQYSVPAVIETNISQPQGAPPPSPVAVPPTPAAPQVIRLKSAAGQPEPPSGGIRFKEQPAPPRPRTVVPPAADYASRVEPAENARASRGIWKYAAAIVVILVAGFAAMTMKWSGSGKGHVEPGTLVIETTPAGSQIFVDGDVKGLTPATLPLPPGRHEIKLTRKNASHSWTVEIVSGARRVERLDWSALFSTGGVEVVSNNPGAKVFVDGKPRGEIPITITDLSPGRHVILAQSPSGNVRRTVTIVAGETTKLDLAIYSGWVVVGSPIELEVVENGNVIGQAGQGPLVLPAGRHRIELVNDTYGFRSSHDIEIRPGEEERIVEDPMGILNVNATPWAEVWVDGKRAGETPLANVKVPLGTREILFKHPQYGERRVTVTVTAKEPVQLAVDMTKAQ